jgi:DNA-binding transcriptional MocR family regulator
MKPGEWYWVDKAVVQKYARKVGFLAITAYHFLASMADESQNCYPSQKYVAEKLGCSRGAVSKAIKKLVDNRLIETGKRMRTSRMYHLLDLRMLPAETEMFTVGNQDVAQGNTNNNKEQNIDNNTFVSVKKSYTPIKLPYDGTNPESREELLANDLSEALDDQSHYALYLSYAKEYPEPFLRRVLAETRMTPDKKIRKSRAALFNYLLYHYAGKRN